MYEPQFELSHLSFKVGEKLILNDANFSIGKGDFVTITGPSGSGKSTLLKIIASMLSETSGSICYKGKKVEEYNPIDYRKKVSYCFQTAVLFGKTVRDNLSFPYDIRQESFDREHAIYYLDKVGLSESYLEKKISDLSGGEKQRIALARALVRDVPVIILDEATSAIDKETTDEIENFILSREDKTVIMISHHLDENIKAKCDKVYDLNEIKNSI